MEQHYLLMKNNRDDDLEDHSKLVADGASLCRGKKCFKSSKLGSGSNVSQVLL